jgi:predicted TPR repeat methyltransferase
VIDLCELNGTYDVITAVFDMVNYLDTNNLERFLHCVANHLHPNGYFICDINTLYGFENVAVGSFIVDDEDRFVTVDSEFEEGVYHSEFTLFEKKRDHFIKSQEKITQYYHSVEEIIKRSGFTLVNQDEVNLYGFDEADKMFLVLKK